MPINGWMDGQKEVYPLNMGFPSGASGEESTCRYRRCGRGSFDPWVGKTPWRRAWQPTPGFLPGESHGQRSLAGYSPRGRRELDTTKDAHMHHSLESDSTIKTNERLIHTTRQLSFANVTLPSSRIQTEDTT